LNYQEIKSYSKQIFEALAYLHGNKIIHRDIKPENFLIGENGDIVLCDFDLARYYKDKSEIKTKNPCTLYYKPPEILVGCRNYDDKIDIWGAGCIIYEMIMKKPLFDTKTEIGVLCKIFEILGSPNVRNKFIFLFYNLKSL
jgi:serine/threonine protein kinase